MAKKAERLAKDVLILNTIELKSLMDKTKKTDRVDAEKIAIILRRFEKEELSYCLVKSEKWAEVKGLLKIREKLVRQKVETKNLIIAMLDYWGLAPEKKLFMGQKRDEAWLEGLVLSPALKEGIKRQYQLVIEYNEMIKELDDQIFGLCATDKAYQTITKEIDGIGKTCGAYLVSKIENIERFDSHKKLVSYLGLAPKVNESDEKNRGGHITRNTDKAILRVIVQAAWAAVRFDPYMRKYYDDLRSRTCKQKAIVAIARKLVVKVFYYLKNNKA